MNARVYTAPEVYRIVRAGAFLLVLTAAAALLLTQRIFVPVAVLVAAALIAWNWQKQSGWGNFWEIASFSYLVFFIADLFVFSRALAPSLVHLFTFILVNKLFNLHSLRDYHHLFLLTFLTILAATSMSVEIEMFYMIILYIVLLVWNIVSLILYSEWKESREPTFPMSLLSPMYVATILGSSVITFAVALCIFFLMPRMQLGFFGNLKQEKIQYVSGFSQKVDLGDINNIQADPDVAMRIRVTGGAGVGRPATMYWRGIAFDHYDGKSWSATVPGPRFLFQDSSQTYYASRYGGTLESLLRQEFYMEPINTRVIFGLDRIVRVHGAFGQISRDANGTLIGMSRPSTYEVWSRHSAPTLDELKRAADDLPDAVGRYYLQIPSRSAEMESLARRIASSETTTIERALVLRNYLQKNYQYSTTDLPGDSEDPISEFLFVKKSGHCEYFASSLVLLLRHIGIPARPVNGFREGEYNTIGGFYVVRNSDAHTWVEAYIGQQWIMMDPSPARVVGTGFTWGSFLNPRRIFESISFFWDRYILIYSGQDQVDTFLNLRDRYRDIRRSLRKQFRSPEPLPARVSRILRENGKTIALILTVAVVSVLAFRIWSRRRRRQLVTRTPILFYQEVLRILAKKGYPRPPHSTPAEFARAMNDEVFEGSADLKKLTDLFYRARFGGYRLTSSDHAAVHESLRRLEGR